ncbi:Glucosaminyl phosphatidylinositol (GlcN-PI) nositol acylation protein [Tilletia horrida]|nr:Glucosaminyl phosphatidylinositol (GlcN-PI) nositol acylation protein [Tilletia horrida]
MQHSNDDHHSLTKAMGDDGDYRTAKEGFVSGLSGASVHAINAVSLTALTTYALWSVARTRIPHVAASPRAQLAICIAPLLLSTTALAHHPLALNALLYLAAAALAHRLPVHDRLAARKYSWKLFAASSTSSRHTHTGNSSGSKKKEDQQPFLQSPSIPSPTSDERRRDGDDEEEDNDDEQQDEDEDKLRGVSSTASVSGEESRRSLSLRHRRSRSRGSHSASRAFLSADDTTNTASSSSAVTSAFRLAREGIATSTVSQHALAAFQDMKQHQQQQQYQQQQQQEANASHLFTPIPPTPTTPIDAPSASASASPERWAQQRRSRGKRKHQRHWSKAYLDSDEDDLAADEAGSSPGAEGMDASQEVPQPNENTAEGSSSSSGQLRRIPSSGYRIGRPHAAGREPTLHEEFSVAVESAPRQQQESPNPTPSAAPPYLTPDELRRREQEREASTGAASAANKKKGAPSPLEFAVKIAMPIRPFLTIYRAHMMLMTIICILAVDFPIFPRAFAKCETWGTSLMDMGVGSFVFSLGLVSAGPELRRSVLRALQLRQPPNSTFSPSSPLTEPGLAAQLAQDLRRSLPVLVLGVVRVLLVKSTEYPEHVSEYGVHWNFFITLGLLPVLGTIVRAGLALTSSSSSSSPSSKSGSPQRGRKSGTPGYSLRMIGAALTLGLLTQLALWLTPLQAWAISNDALVRGSAGLLSANKEGLVSLPGYVVLYLLGLDLGAYVLPADPYLAHRLRAKRQLRSRRERLEAEIGSGSVAGHAGGIGVGAAAAAQNKIHSQNHSRTSSLGSIVYGPGPVLGDADGARHRTSEDRAPSSHGHGHSHHASTSSYGHGQSYGHGANASVSSIAGMAGASPLHVHVLRHRPNGSLSRLSTSSDGLSSIFLHPGGGVGPHPTSAGAGSGSTASANGREFRAPRSHSDKLAMVLFSFASMWWGLYFLLWLCGVQPSRRIANMMYVVWVSAYNTSFLLGYLLIHMCLLEPLERAGIERAAVAAAAAAAAQQTEEGAQHSGQKEMAVGAGPESNGIQVQQQQRQVVSFDAVLRKEGTTPLLLEILNRHSLAVFLVANILTGLINLSMKTMYAPDWAALLVLALYLVACFGSAVALETYQIRLRL